MGNCCKAKNITCAKKGKALLQALGDAQLATASTKHSLDPDAMDIDTMYLHIAALILTLAQNTKWKKAMKDQCYVCSDKNHCSKECSVQKDHKPCSHCKGKGHTQHMCLQCFAGLAPGAAPKRLEKPSCCAAIGCLKDNKEKPFNLGVSPDTLDSASAAAGDNDKPALKLATLSSAKRKKNKKKVVDKSSKPGKLKPTFLAAASTTNLHNQLAKLQVLNTQLLNKLKDAQDAAVNLGF
jgi:hypothetical protein